MILSNSKFYNQVEPCYYLRELSAQLGMDLKRFTKVQPSEDVTILLL